MPMTPREMIQLLEQHGFRYVRSNGSHRLYKNPVSNITVVVPFHNKALKKGTEQNILKLAGLK